MARSTLGRRGKDASLVLATPDCLDGLRRCTSTLPRCLTATLNATIVNCHTTMWRGVGQQRLYTHTHTNTHKTLQPGFPHTTRTGTHPPALRGNTRTPIAKYQALCMG
eukprot:363308-Chlamydomonas_euryale.AAC.4